MYAERQGWDVVAEFIEPRGGTGVHESKRPRFRAMIAEALASHRPFDYILVHSYSRFYRDQAVSSLLRRDLKKKRIWVRSLTQEVHEDSGGADIQVEMMSLFDEYQSHETSKHVRRTMEANAREGFSHLATVSPSRRSVGFGTSISWKLGQTRLQSCETFSRVTNRASASPVSPSS
jgi:site-specific DNA recombinase